MTTYVVADWKRDLDRANSSNKKEWIYRLVRPLLNALYRRRLSHRALAEFKPYLVLGSRGFPLVARRKWGTFGIESFSCTTVVVQGTGNGWDLTDWARYGPGKLIGIDLFAFDRWNEVKQYVEQNLRVTTEFHAAPLDDIPFIPDGSVDFCASDAVLEHLRNLDKFLNESFRILKPGGIVYATYGPLWYCAGGDHFSGRGGLKNVFNHVLLNQSDYIDYFRKHKAEEEDFQSGGRYVELDLFSKLKTADYLEAFRRAGFTVESLIIELSGEAMRFKRQFSPLWKDILKKNVEITEDDLIIKANFVRLRKPGSVELDRAHAPSTSGGHKISARPAAALDAAPRSPPP